MKKLSYDTETTGLPNWGVPSTDPTQPRIISLAADLHDITGRTFGAMNVLIKPEGWTVPDDISAMTGITTEMCELYGVPIQHALAMFIELWQQSDERVGHNESFDMRMVRIELVRCPHFSVALANGIPFADHWKAGPAFCTQAKSTKIVNASRPDGDKKKTASLGEAYRHFTGRELEGAHSAWNDTQGAKTVYLALQQLEGNAA